ncbi:hypothetical protein [Paenibacillus sp. FJAT-27812]|uniref:hypothetical protein n=1 Tax=Paenibacillus sp. FJAT-27812 TaxID=1684143 RepID=UPI0006A7A95A|nr:hypothetical protein [Paenibacillus sp. FJAT-27812]
MGTFYAMVRESGVFFCELLLKDFQQASIKDVPVIHEMEIITTEGRNIAHDGKWIPIHTVETLTAAPKPRAKIGSVDKATVISRIQEHLNHQSDEVSEVTISNTSSHCEEIGGRIAKQVVSTIEARNYFDEHLVELGWQVAKAGKDFITLKRMPSVEETAEEEVKAALEQAVDHQVVETEEGSKRSFLEKLLR